MATKYFALLTNIGAEKLANATALGAQVEITQMAVGDGNGALPTPNPAQTALTHELRRAQLNMLTIDPVNTNQIIAEQVIPEDVGGWWIREIGLFDKDGDMIAVANCAETYKPQLQEGSGRVQVIRVILIVSSTEAVTLKIDPSVVLATRKYVDDAVIEVKAYADDVMKKHVAAANPHKQYPLIANALKEMVDAGLVNQILENLGLGGGLTGVIGQARNLAMSLATAGTTATWTADELITETALGGTQYRNNSLSLTVNLAIVGAGGVDVAGTVPTNGFMAIYAISGPGKTTSALGWNATSSKAPETYSGTAMPAGYTASALISVWRIANGQFVPGYQLARKIYIPKVAVLTLTANVASYTALSVSGIIPLNAKTMGGCANVNPSTSASNNYFFVSGSASEIGAQFSGTNNSGVMTPFADIPLITPQTLYYIMVSTGTMTTSYIYATEYEI
ncbi:phage tail protein [Escherichia coli]|uniref:phage tail protein n=2 Tax=Enterobacteriaceae TaxID=543 RepID=UPI001069ED5B|nr:phage tail protein [Escherichia coli]EIH9540010.1 phage tail protein [Escherichia coli]VFS94276.1 phage tail collar protein [Escherichia coli]HAI2337499.1 phage tail protein [Escherichia coli]